MIFKNRQTLHKMAENLSLSDKLNLIRLCNRVAELNPDVGTIGPGMLADLIETANFTMIRLERHIND